MRSKRTVIVSVLLCFAACLQVPPVRGQHYPAERVILCTDRTFYVAGEEIRFTAFVLQEDLLQAGRLSRVIYCELVSPDGKKFSGAKYRLPDGKSSGSLPVPTDLVTGVYYLRAYTRYLRNAGPGTFAYEALKIVNPARPEFLPGDPAVTDTAGTIVSDPLSGPEIGIMTDKTKYYPGENIVLRLAGNFPDSLIGLSVSVVPEAAWQPGPPVRTMTAPIARIRDFPETRGPSLTGSVVDISSGMPLPGITVGLTLISNRDFQAVTTDSAGHFYFALPDATGDHDLFLSPAEVEGAKPEIRIDNDFCPDFIRLPAPPFSLAPRERDLALNMAGNVTIAAYYAGQSPEDSTPPGPGAFYGKPSMVLQFDKYIQLPTLEEYFSELSGPVQVRKKKKKKVLKVYSEIREMATLSPLVMIDLVAVDDMEKILASNPQGIDRVEVVDKPYVKGGITYGGIVSVISRKNDFAGFDLPSAGLFINYPFYRDTDRPIPPFEGPRLTPDTRNTLFWEPSLPGGVQLDQLLSFSASGLEGNYLIIARGVTAGGAIMLSAKRLEIIRK